MATILVVDDHPPNRDLLTTLLGYQGHTVLTAADGSAALVLARTEGPALVITDILMPTMDGYELVRQLRLDPATARIPVMFYTAHYLDREARALAAACGVTHILHKPTEPQAVLRMVDMVLRAPPQPWVPPPQPDFDRAHLQVVDQ